MKTKALIVNFLMLLTGLQAQNPFHRIYDTRYMIPSSETYDGIQDDKGYLWFSCDHGLVRFDGYQFRNYEIKDGLPENSVCGFRKDAEGRIWVNSYGGKLAYIKEGQIKPYAYNAVLDSFMRAEEMSNNTVFLSYWIDKQSQAHLYLRKAGYVVVDTAGKISKHSIPGSHTLHVMFDAEGEAFFTGPGQQFYDSAVVHHNGKCWAVSLAAIKQDFNISRNLFAVSLDEKVLLGFQYSAFLIGPDGIEKIFNSPYYLSSVGVDLSGRLWLLTVGGGLYVADKNLNLLHHYFQGESFSSFVQDHEGGIWLTSLNKGFFYIPSTNHFTLSAEDGFPSQTVANIAHDDDGQLWIAYTNGRVVIAKNGRLTQLDLGLTPFETINEMVFDPCLNRVWVGTSARLLYCNVHERQFFQISSPEKKWGKRYPIKSMAFDENNCILWIGQFNGVSNLKALKYENRYNRVDKPLNDRVESIKAGKNGLVWVGTSSGLYKFENDEMVYYGDKYPILKNRIVALNTFGDTLWIGTKGHGLLMLVDDSLKQFTKNDGLPSNSVKSISFLDKKILVGTNEGMALMEMPLPYKTLMEVKTMGYRELISKEIEKIVVANDTVYIATKVGISMLNNMSKPDPEFEMPLHIRQIFVENRPVQNLENLRLPFRNNNITFEFFGISLIKTGKLTYRHRLLGLENDWVIDQQIVAQYPFLPPGSYRFEVEVQHPDGHWSHQPASFSFVVAKPYWREWWFLLLIGISVLLLFLLSMQIYGKIRMRRERMLNDINRYQQEALVCQMNPHFLFNALNTVQRYILENDKTSSSRYLSVFARLMRRILEQAQISFHSVKNEQELLRLYIEMEAARFSNRFEYNLTTDTRIDVEKTQIPVFLIQPLVENAIKHGLMNSSNPGKLSVFFGIKNEFDLICEVEDNGIGRKAASEISRTLEKTSLGLNILQKRILLLNQRSDSPITLTYYDLSDKNGQPSGTRVILCFPNIVKHILENE